MITVTHDNSHSDDGVPAGLRPRKVPVQERAHTTVDAILDAAAHILVSNPELLSTNAVAERAGVSVGSLYQYYPNKDAIVAALLRRQARTEAEFVLARLAAVEPRSLRAALSVAMNAAFEFRAQTPELHQALLDQMQHIPQFPALIAEARQAAHGLGQLLAAFQTEIRRPNHELALHVVCNAAFSLTHRGLFPRPGGVEDAAYLEEIVSLLTAYLTSPGR